MNLFRMHKLIFKKNKTVGDIERIIGIPGFARNKNGRDTRSDKYLSSYKKRK